MRLGLVLLAVAACDAQVPDGYAGEPVARIHGMPIGFSATDRAPDGALVRWNSQRGADLAAGPTTPLPLESAPPSGVTVLLLAAPPEDAYFEFADGSPRLAEGYLVLTRDGDVVAATVGVALVFADGDVASGTMAAAYLDVAAAAGFHRFDQRATATLSAPQAYFAKLCGGGDPCNRPRLYQLAPKASDLATSVPFFRRGP